MAKGTGTYDDPIICDGIFSKTINGVKKFFKLKTGSSVDTSQFIKKSGDILTGNRFTRDIDNDYLYLNGGTQQNGASLVLYGKDSKIDSISEGSAELRTKSDLRLQCKDNGALLWNNKNILRSVNGALADINGNVSDIAEQNIGYFRFTNGIQICYFCGHITINTTTEGTGYIWNFPVPFYEIAYIQNAIPSAGFLLNTTLQTYNWSKTQMNIKCSEEYLNKGVYIYMFALGVWK